MEELILKDPKQDESHFGLAKVFLYKNELTEAIASIEKAL